MREKKKTTEYTWVVKITVASERSGITPTPPRVGRWQNACKMPRKCERPAFRKTRRVQQGRTTITADNNLETREKKKNNRSITHRKYRVFPRTVQRAIGVCGCRRFDLCEPRRWSAINGGEKNKKFQNRILGGFGDILRLELRSRRCVEQCDTRETTVCLRCPTMWWCIRETRRHARYACTNRRRTYEWRGVSSGTLVCVLVRSACGRVARVWASLARVCARVCCARARSLRANRTDGRTLATGCDYFIIIYFWPCPSDGASVSSSSAVAIARASGTKNENQLVVEKYRARDSFLFVSGGFFSLLFSSFRNV